MSMHMYVCIVVQPYCPCTCMYACIIMRPYCRCPCRYISLVVWLHVDAHVGMYSSAALLSISMYLSMQCNLIVDAHVSMYICLVVWLHVDAHVGMYSSAALLSMPVYVCIYPL